MFGGLWHSSTSTVTIRAIVYGTSTVAGPTDPTVSFFSRIVVVVVVVEAVGFGFSCDDVRVLTRRHISGKRSSLSKKRINKV